MTSSPNTTATTHTLEAPGATLTYDIRRNAASTAPPLMLLGSPMGASGFETLASHFPDRTVVTYDPRGADRSKRTDGAPETQVAEHADDIHRVIGAVGGGPVDMFATSGGAVNALALVERHPEDVRILVAHEPPAVTQIPDREPALAAARDIHDTYLRRGYGPAMAKFIVLVSQVGELPADFASRPDPDPAMFGLPTEDDGRRDDPLLGQNIVTGNMYEFDYDKLRSASTRILLVAGEQSTGTLASRGAFAVAERLGTTPTMFPSHHAGFMGGDHGMAGEPEAFATRLREVLAAAEAAEAPDAAQAAGASEADRPRTAS